MVMAMVGVGVRVKVTPQGDTLPPAMSNLFLQNHTS